MGKNVQVAKWIDLNTYRCYSGKCQVIQFT